MTTQPSGGAPPNNGGEAAPPPSRTGTPVDPGPEPDWPANTSCAAQPGELYAIKPTRLFENDEFPLCAFKGRVLFIVNGASFCGYTYQYGPLQQKIYARYKSQGLSVLAFPSKSFNQEGTTDEISTNCVNQYGIKFPLFAVANVNPPNEQPVYTWLKAQPVRAGDPTGAIEWNFAKFIVGKTGTVVARFAHTVEPDAPQVISVIEAELAK